MVAANLSLGQIVSWTSPAGVPIETLRKAIAKAGLEDSLIRKMLPRNAFARAARKLAENRVITQTGEEGDVLYFQFTRQEVDVTARQAEYWREAVLSLSKASGDVECISGPRMTDAEQAELVATVTSMIDAEIANRTASDVTTLVQRIFIKGSADLVAIREAGGAYFIPANQMEVVDRVAELMQEVGGTLRRFSIGSGDVETRRSVAESMDDHFARLVREFKDSCENISPDSMPSVMRNRRLRIKELRFKLESFRDLLAGHADGLANAIEDAEAHLNDRRSGAGGELPFVAENARGTERVENSGPALTF